MGKGHGRPKQALRPTLGLRVLRRRGLFAAQSPRFLKDYRRVILPTYRLVMRNLPALKNFVAVEDKAKGIFVQRGATGIWWGKKNAVTLKVRFGRAPGRAKEFFVRVGYGSREPELEALAVADRWLKKKGYRFGKFNMRVLKPLLLYDAPNKTSWLVSRFFAPMQVAQVADLQGQKAGAVKRAVGQIGMELSGLGVKDVVEENAFYEKKTNTIWLFDLESEYPGM